MVRNFVPIQCYMIFLPYDFDVMWIHNFFFFAPLAIALMRYRALRHPFIHALVAQGRERLT